MDLETYERRHRRFVYGCLIGLGTLLHLMVALLTLGARTSCAWPPCHTSMWFHAWAWFWSAPVFVTPWVRLPIEEMGFGWTPQLVALMVLNSVTAVGLLLALAWLCRQAMVTVRRWRRAKLQAA